MMQPAQSVLTEKVAIVTGGAQGLGAHFAATLAQCGATIIVADVRSVEKTCAQIGSLRGQCEGIELDVSDGHAVREAFRDIASRYGHVDILVNSAAIAATIQPRPLTDIESEEWDHVLAVNARGTFECIKAAAKIMKSQFAGKIINMTSGVAIKGTPGLAHYAASKGAIIALTRVAARELGEFGICVNAIAPGLTMHQAIRQSPAWTKEVRAVNIASRALKREAIPSDIAGALIFLASAASDFITGQTLSVDGGSTMN